MPTALGSRYSPAATTEARYMSPSLPMIAVPTEAESRNPVSLRPAGHALRFPAGSG